MDRNQIHQLHAEILSPSFETSLYLLRLIYPRTPFLAVFQYVCKWQRKNNIRNELVWFQRPLERWSCKTKQQKGNPLCRWLFGQNSNSLPLNISSSTAPHESSICKARDVEEVLKCGFWSRTSLLTALRKLNFLRLRGGSSPSHELPIRNGTLQNLDQSIMVSEDNQVV